MASVTGRGPAKSVHNFTTKLVATGVSRSTIKGRFMKFTGLATSAVKLEDHEAHYQVSDAMHAHVTVEDLFMRSNLIDDEVG